MNNPQTNEPVNDITDDLYVMAADDSGVVRTGIYMLGAGTLAAYQQRTIRVQGTTRRAHADIELPLIDDSTDPAAVGGK